MLEEKETVDALNSDNSATIELNDRDNSKSESQTETKESETSIQEEQIVEDELTVAKKEVLEQKDKYLRLFAEFDNFKKRNAKERLELFKTAGQEVIRELLPILDDFQRADKALAQDNNTENYANGIKLIQEKLVKILQNKGLKTIESLGKDFDVAQHEAIAEVPATDENLKGKIIDEVESGYTLNDTIIRYAKVVVGK